MPSTADAGSRRYALVVATTDYDDRSLTRLRSPAQDADDMANVLSDPRIGGFTVTPVLNRPETEVRRTIAAFLSARQPDDLVVLYLSCHGLLDASGRLYFATTDTAKDQLRATAVEAGWVLDVLDDCPARSQVVILDCCFSGAFHGVKGDVEVDLGRRPRDSGRGRHILTASRASEYSFEGEPLGDGVAAGSVFTSALVEGLRSGDADRDRDGRIMVDDAYHYARDLVRHVRPDQNPQRWLFRGEEEILLAFNPRVDPAPPVPSPTSAVPAGTTPSTPLRVPTPAGAPAPAQADVGRSSAFPISRTMLATITIAGLLLAGATAGAIVQANRREQTIAHGQSPTPSPPTSPADPSPTPQVTASSVDPTPASNSRSVLVPAPTADPPRPKGQAAAVTVNGPPNGEVPRCWDFSGTATLPPGKSLAMGVLNTSNGESTSYFHEVWRWKGSAWTRVHYFGDTPGQSYRVTTFVVDEEVLRAAIRAEEDPSGHDWEAVALPSGAETVDTRTVTRIEGEGEGC